MSCVSALNGKLKVKTVLYLNIQCPVYGTVALRAPVT